MDLPIALARPVHTGVVDDPLDGDEVLLGRLGVIPLSIK